MKTWTLPLLVHEEQTLASGIRPAEFLDRVVCHQGIATVRFCTFMELLAAGQGRYRTKHMHRLAEGEFIAWSSENCLLA